MTVKIIQHCFGKSASGGPVMAMERLIRHSSFVFGELRQTEAAGGLDLRLLFRFTKELRRARPALVHVRGLGNEGFHAALAARLAGVPNILVSVHGTHMDLQFPNSRLRHWVVTHVLEPLTLVMATHIATVCEYATTRPFLQRYRKKLVAVVPNGVDLPALSALQVKVKVEFSIPQELPMAVTVSRITTEKGYLPLAMALRILDISGHRFALLIVGGGDENGEIRAQFDGLRNVVVHFVGHQVDVARFLAESDFFVFPSLHENLSNALLEAMSYGLPVIATAVGGNIEVMQKGGGLLVPVNNAEALADAISSFLADQAEVKRMGIEARENVRRHYSVKKMVAGWEGIYASILEGDHAKKS